MTRTDTHRPTAMVPEDYTFVAFEHEPKTGDVLGDAYIQAANRQQIRRHMEMTGGKYSRHEHGGICGICGNANAIYTALFHHKPTNTYIRTGRECADKLDAGVNFDHFIRGVKAALEAKAGKAKAQATLIADGLEAAWAVTMQWNAPEGHPEPYEHRTIRDIVGKLVKYGSISTAQTNYLRKLLDKIATGDTAAARQEAYKAERAAQEAAALPVPVTDKRIVIRGKVLTVREQDSNYFYNAVDLKCLVMAEDGWKVWGTLPRAFGTDVQGRTVEFSAKVKRSDNDPKFGFFSRPTKAQLIDEVAP